MVSSTTYSCRISEMQTSESFKEYNHQAELNRIEDMKQQLDDLQKEFRERSGM